MPDAALSAPVAFGLGATFALVPALYLLTKRRAIASVACRPEVRPRVPSTRQLGDTTRTKPD